MVQIVLCTNVEKNLQSAETMLRMATSGERWLCLLHSNRWPAEMCAYALATPCLGIVRVNTGEMPGRIITMASEGVYGPVGHVVADIMNLKRGGCLIKVGCSGTMYPWRPGKEEAPRKRRHTDEEPPYGLTG